MINPSLKNKFREDRKRYGSYTLGNNEKHEEYKAEKCDYEMTEGNYFENLHLRSLEIDGYPHLTPPWLRDNRGTRN